MQIRWQIQTFEQLTSTSLYEILKLRAEVFVAEQNCSYVDLDGKDFFSLHVLGFSGDKLVAYARLVQPGVSYPEWAIGRVVVDPEYRNKSLGFELMKKSINFLELKKDAPALRISAQSHLKSFYSSLGFSGTGKSYLEDGIPHIEMLRIKKAAPKGDPH